MQNRLSLGTAFFKKAIGSSTSSRCVFQAEYDTKAGVYLLTRVFFLQRRGRISSVTKTDEKCASIGDCFRRLAAASDTVGQDGYKFDQAAMLLLDVPNVEPEEDEDWLEGLNVKRVRSGKEKPSNKH